MMLQFFVKNGPAATWNCLFFEKKIQVYLRWISYSTLKGVPHLYICKRDYFSDVQSTYLVVLGVADRCTTCVQIMNPPAP